jgi:hypothetical protein
MIFMLFEAFAFERWRWCGQLLFLSAWAHGDLRDSGLYSDFQRSDIMTQANVKICTLSCRVVPFLTRSRRTENMALMKATGATGRGQRGRCYCSTASVKFS